MFDYKQRETTEEYREGWDRIWGKKEEIQIEEGDEVCGKTQLKEYLN